MFGDLPSWIVIPTLLIVGIALLTIGAELLVRGASRLAISLGVPSLVVGLTIVAFGTSAPELVVSVQSSLAGKPDVALGNVVGSNIFNVLLILGASAVIVPLTINRQLVRFDVPVMLGVSILVVWMAQDGNLSRWEAVGLFGGLIAYTILTAVIGRREKAAADALNEAEPVPKASLATLAVDGFLVAVGLGLLILGSRWFVDGAVSAAQLMGISELVIGLTVVAAGTSLPEVATSLMAAWRGERDIAVGNVVGSNLFNMLGVLGVTGAISATGLPVAEQAKEFDLPMMVFVAIACVPIFFVGQAIERWEGLLFLFHYVVYTTYLVVNANDAVAGATMLWWMLAVLLPLTILFIAISSVYQAYFKKRPAAVAMSS